MKIVAFDTETRGLDWFDPDQRAFMVSWADDQGAWTATNEDEEGIAAFLASLASADLLVCHNLSFDVHQVRETYGWDALTSGAELHDTALMSRVMFPSGAGAAPRHGLKHLASVHLYPEAADEEKHMMELADGAGINMKKTGGYFDLWRAYPEVMEDYARQDARITYDLFTTLTERMTDEEHRVYALEQAVAPVLIAAEQRGTSIAQEPVVRLRDSYRVEAEAAEAELLATLGQAALGGEGSTQALVDALLAHGIPLHQVTESGQFSTNKFALQEFEEDFPIIGTLQRWRTANKFLTTYIEPMVDRDVVHPSFSQLGAWTSRMSCRRPNMQNIPNHAGKEVREMFVPRPGYCFVVADYDSIEVRLLAYYLGDPGFRKLIEDGHDPHSWMASNIHGGSMEQYLKGTDGQPLRDKAKNTLFAITYGGGGKRITDMNKLDPGPYYPEDHPAVLNARSQGKWWPKVGWQYNEGRALIKKIKAALPNYNRLTARIRGKVESVGYVNTIWGRRNMVNKDKAYVGLNALIQGSAADIMKQGLVNVADSIRSLDGHVLLVVHDEVVVEVPVDRAEECRGVVEQALCAAYDLSPSLAVTSSTTTKNYADAK